jgi:hypothetical protein
VKLLEPVLLLIALGLSPAIAATTRAALGWGVADTCTLLARSSYYL